MSFPPIVVFDLDGTLAETAGDLIGTLNVILADEGVAAIPFEKARDLVGAGARALIRRGFAFAERDLSEAKLDQLFDRFLSHYSDNILVHTHLYEGVETALEELVTEGFRLAVCTNKMEAPARKLLRLIGIADRFAYIAGKDTFAVSKPDPFHLTETIRRADGDPRRAIMVGDSKTDIDTAKAAGIPVIAVPFGYTDRPVSELGPDRIINHFQDLPSAVRDMIRSAA